MFMVFSLKKVLLMSTLLGVTIFSCTSVFLVAQAQTEADVATREKQLRAEKLKKKSPNGLLHSMQKSRKLLLFSVMQRF